MTKVFAYQARSREGRRIDGTVALPSFDAVLEHLRNRELTVIRVEAATAMNLRPRVLFKYLRDETLQTVLILRGLSLMLQAGIPLSRALRMLAEEMQDHATREAVLSMLSSIDQGASLTAAMRMHHTLFSRTTVALTEAAEQSGTLVAGFERHAEELENNRALQRRIFIALVYPLSVLVAATGLIIYVLIAILPGFVTLFTQFSVAPPLTLRLLVSLRDNVLPVSMMGFGCCLLIVAILRFKRHDPLWQLQLDSLRIRLPLLGRMFRYILTARFARTLAALLAAGVGIIPALEISKSTLHSVVYMRAVGHIIDELQDGATITDALRTRTDFDPLFLHLVAIGEETGSLVENLFRAAQYYDHHVREYLAAATSCIEPCIVAVVGLVVGCIVFSVFVPLYSLVGNIR